MTVVSSFPVDRVGRVPSPPTSSGRPERGEGRSGSAVTTQVISDYATFLDLEDQWNDAVDRAGVTDPFLRHAWLRTWWDCFGGDRQLHLIVVRQGERIVAIAPLMRETVQMYHLPIRKIDFIHNDHTPRIDFIVTGQPAEAYGAIWKALRETRDRWDLLQLSRIPRGSATCDAMRRLAEGEQCATGLWQGDVSPYLTLTGTWEEYQAGLSAKFRSNLRNRLSRLAKLGTPALEILEDAQAIAAARDEALRLEASGWKQESGTSICSDPAVERFYTLLTERATREGWLRLMFLTSGGRRIATSYGSRFGNRLFLFKTGYDPEFATCSPFKLLTWFAIQAAYAEGLSEVDFLGDAEPWKLEWTDTSRPHDWLFVFSGSVRARLLHSVKFQMVPELKKWRA
jgi:CelD/BcsL family acetyltransferase involved in cellulose biosynthesis